MTAGSPLRGRSALVAGTGGIAEAVRTALQEAGATVATTPLAAAADEAWEGHEDLDLLVCVATWERAHAATDLPLDRWRREVAGTLTAAFGLAQAAAQRMLARRGGCVVFVVPHAADAAQRAARQGLVGLTKVLGTEWVGRGVRVVAVTAAAPGAAPADLAPVVVFACSDRATFVTGSEIAVRGHSERRTSG